jgi:hypothetical protein
MMCYLIEEAMPKEYYTNMLPVLADMQILQHIFNSRYPDLVRHFKKVGIGLEMMALPCFITVFTNCPSTLVDVILDFFFLDGHVTLFKVIIAMFNYMRKDILKIHEMGTPIIHQANS